MPSRRRRVHQRGSLPVVVLTNSVYAPLRHIKGTPHGTYQAIRALRDAVSHTAALPVEWHGLACTGWAGEKVGLFEQPSFLLTLSGVWQESPF